MAHLMQPVDVDGTKYCLDCETGRATKGIVTNNHLPDVEGPNSASIPTGEECGEWILMDASSSLEGEISFGVGCHSSTEITFSVVGPTSCEVEISAFVNGLIDQSITVTNGSTGTITVTGAAGACGLLIALTCEVNSLTAFDFTVNAEVTSIT